MLDEAIIYQVFIRSFADSNGDGIGVSLGPLGRLNHLKTLRVTVLWLNSHYDTPNVDNGYDILIIGRSLKISGHWTI
ncbi:alpha-amylase family glycosyl hydrolase [Gluconobacter cerinus]